MARRFGKTYSNPSGYRTSLTGTGSGSWKRSQSARWGASPIKPGYKPGAGAPKFLSAKPTETKEDMDERRAAIDKWLLDHTRTSDAENQEGSRFADNPRAGVTPDQEREVLAAVASHGTVEASQRGMYSGRTVQAPSSSGEIAKGFEHLYGKEGGGGLTDRQKEGVERSVNAEIESRLEAKRGGAAYTGAHSADEQARQNLAYQDSLVKQFGEAGAKERLGDRWTETSAGPGGQTAGTGPVTREFAPGIAGYTVQPGPGPGRDGNGSDPGSDEREIASAAGKRPDADILADKSSPDADFIAAAERQANAIFDRQGPSPPDDEDDSARADDKGGQSGPVGLEPSMAEAEPEPDFVPPSEFSPLFRAPAFDDPAEAARAIAADPDMDYPDLVDAADAVAAPNGSEPEGYDPDAVFRGVLERRIVSDLFASLAAARRAEQASADYYHGSNARSVVNACGASPDEYALALELSGQGDPSALLRMQMKFMDSF